MCKLTKHCRTVHQLQLLPCRLFDWYHWSVRRYSNVAVSGMTHEKKRRNFGDVTRSFSTLLLTGPNAISTSTSCSNLALNMLCSSKYEACQFALLELELTLSLASSFVVQENSVVRRMWHIASHNVRWDVTSALIASKSIRVLNTVNREWHFIYDWPCLHERDVLNEGATKLLIFWPGFPVWNCNSDAPLLMETTSEWEKNR